MGSVCLPVARHFLSKELQEWVPGVPQASSPCAAADPLAVMSALQLLLPATAVTVCSGITWDFICLPVKDSTACVDTHQLSTWFPRPLWHTEGITELLWWQRVCTATATAGMASPVLGYQIWRVTSPWFMSCPWGAALGLQAVLSCHFDRGMCWLYPQHPLMTRYNASRNTWNHQTEQCKWHEELFPPCKPSLPCEKNMIINMLYRILGTKLRVQEKTPEGPNGLLTLSVSLLAWIGFLLFSQWL